MLEPIEDDAFDERLNKIRKDLKDNQKKIDHALNDVVFFCD